ncbi:hypothetical protein SASPL_117621 [Salvia splendens]|uniref:Uncharacterized protein n=1 Tax=Salvia splendens TaxID=180675 RepID=A0A8X8XYN9_SALSN|nr:hypothetical protein SASPL_117621 [Salvia splendens]
MPSSSTSGSTHTSSLLTDLPTRLSLSLAEIDIVNHNTYSRTTHSPKIQPNSVQLLPPQPIQPMQRQARVNLHLLEMGFDIGLVPDGPDEAQEKSKEQREAN